MSELLSYALGLAACFLLWTLVIYWLHRLSHVNHRRNPLLWLHRAHHALPYLKEKPSSYWPKPAQFLFWLGGWRLSLDVIVTMTLPLVAIALIWPKYGLPLLVFHYLYEVFLSEELLDHNPAVTGRSTRFFAWGDFHLHHHVEPRKNYGLMITLWDHLFRTAHHPEPGSILRRIESYQERPVRTPVRPLRVAKGAENTEPAGA